MTPQMLVGVGELAIGFLSLPMLATGARWLADRLSRERRLLSRVETLSRIYDRLPESDAKTNFGRTLTLELGALNHELDQLLRAERRRKRAVATGAVALMAITAYIATAAHIPPQPLSLVAGLTIGGCMEIAFWWISRATLRSRRLDQERSMSVS